MNNKELINFNKSLIEKMENNTKVDFEIFITENYGSYKHFIEDHLSKIKEDLKNIEIRDKRRSPIDF